MIQFEAFVILFSSRIKLQLINNLILTDKPILDGISDIADHPDVPFYHFLEG
jgi:hypothetical protein